MTTRLELHIDELVLYDFPPEQRQAIAAAVERALSRLFTERGLPPLLAQGGAIPQVEGGPFDAVPGAAPEAVGAQVAQAIYGGLNR